MQIKFLSQMDITSLRTIIVRRKLQLFSGGNSGISKIGWSRSKPKTSVTDGEKAGKCTRIFYFHNTESLFKFIFALYFLKYFYLLSYKIFISGQWRNWNIFILVKQNTFIILHWNSLLNGTYHKNLWQVISHKNCFSEKYWTSSKRNST